jgi:hypothetical protein
MMVDRREYRPSYWRENPDYWARFGGEWYPNHSIVAFEKKKPLEHLFGEPRERGYARRVIRSDEIARH